MMWRVTRTSLSCARQPLVQLLTDQLDAKESARVTEHLDRCEECQQRMTKLAAEPNWWREAGQWLENASIDEELAGEWNEDEFGEQHGASPVESLIESGLMRPSTKLDTIGCIGRYDVRRVIGTGGTGIVLQALDTELDRIIAVKVLAPTFASNGPARRRVSREGQAAAAVVHENVVAIHHVESNGPVPFLVMQFVDGCSLQEQVIRVGPMDATSTLRMVLQLASALEAAHTQGLVHRDVKPANILVGAAGQRYWITDFGLARAVDDASLTRTGFIAGTPHYMSPEQARGETVGPGSDLFGLGSVMYFVLTGRPPFRAERSLAILNRICTEKHRPVREVNPDVPQAVAAIVDRLLEKNASLRYQSANELRDECLKLLSHPESIDQSPKRAESRKKPRRLRASLLVATLALTGLAFAPFVFGSWNRQSTKPPTIISRPVDNRQFGPRTNEQASFTRKPSFPNPNLQSANRAAPTAPKSALREVERTPPSEHELWQKEFDALNDDTLTLRNEWHEQNSQSTAGSSVDSNEMLFEQLFVELERQLDQLESPVTEAIQSNAYPFQAY